MIFREFPEMFNSFFFKCSWCSLSSFSINASFKIIIDSTSKSVKFLLRQIPKYDESQASKLLEDVGKSDACSFKVLGFDLVDQNVKVLLLEVYLYSMCHYEQNPLEILSKRCLFSAELPAISFKKAHSLARKP